MNEPTPVKTQRRLTALELSAPARGALRRLKRDLGMSFTHAVERGLVLLEKGIVLGQERALQTDLAATPTDAERKRLGLPTGPRRVNRKKGGAL